METEPTDEIKAQLGSTSMFSWLIGGALLFLYDGGVGMLFSWQAAVFLGAGIIVAPLLVGVLTYKLFLRLSDRWTGTTTLDEARAAIVRAFRQSRFTAILLAIILVFWCYAIFFRF
jgi:hypothetical protein